MNKYNSSFMDGLLDVCPQGNAVFGGLVPGVLRRSCMAANSAFQSLNILVILQRRIRPCFFVSDLLFQERNCPLRMPKLYPSPDGSELCFCHRRFVRQKRSLCEADGVLPSRTLLQCLDSAPDCCVGTAYPRVESIEHRD